MTQYRTTRASTAYRTLDALLRLGGAEYPENLLRYAGIPAGEPHINAALLHLQTLDLITWDETTGSWRAVPRASAVLAAVDRDVAAQVEERATRDPQTWDSNVADPDDLDERIAYLRDTAWAAISARPPRVDLRIGSIILMPEDMDDELAVIVDSQGEEDPSAVPRWVCRIWSPGTEVDGARVVMSQARAAVLATDPLHQIATAAKMARVSLRQRDDLLRAAGDAHTQHALAAAAGMSQPGVRKVLQRETRVQTSGPDFDRDPWRTELGAALRAAVVDSDRLDLIDCAPDGDWSARRTDGSRLAFGDDGADGYDYTIYGPDDNIAVQDNCRTPEAMAARVAEFLAR